MNEPKSCKHKLQWQQCPFNNLGCNSCLSNNLLPQTARGYLQSARRAHEDKNLEQENILLRRAMGHIIKRLYRTENDYRRERDAHK